MTYQFFLLTFFVAVLGVSAPVIFLFILPRFLKRKTLKGWEPLWLLIGIFIWYYLFFTQSPKLVPEHMKLKPHQEMVCEMKTVYK